MKASLDTGVEELLVNHTWPGNVRELENVLDRALILADDCRITVADLPATISKVAQPSQPSDSFQASGSLREQVRKFETHLILKTIEDAGGDRRAASQKLNIGLSSLYRKLEEIEAQPISNEGGFARHEVRQDQ